MGILLLSRARRARAHLRDDQDGIPPLHAKPLRWCASRYRYARRPQNGREREPRSRRHCRRPHSTSRFSRSFNGESAGFFLSGVSFHERMPCTLDVRAGVLLPLFDHMDRQPQQRRRRPGLTRYPKEVTLCSTRPYGFERTAFGPARGEVPSSRRRAERRRRGREREESGRFERRRSEQAELINRSL